MEKFWKEKSTEWIINGKKYHLHDKILAKKFKFFKKVLEGNFEDDRKVEIKDWNGKLISEKDIDIYIEYVLYLDLASWDSNYVTDGIGLGIKRCIIMYILSDYFDQSYARDIFSKKLRDYFVSYNCKNSLLNLTDKKIIDCNDYKTLKYWDALKHKCYNITSKEYLILKDLFPKAKNLIYMIGIEETLTEIKKVLREEYNKELEKIYYMKKILSLCD